MKKIILTASNPSRVKALWIILSVLVAAEVVLKITYFH